MDENQNPARTPDIADLTALVEEIIGVLEGVGAHALLRSTGRGSGRFRATLAANARELLSGGNRACRKKTSLPLAGPQ